MPNLIGQTIGKYKVERLLGQGGMGVVYLARDQALRRLVALKVMHTEFARESVFQARFTQEARAAARLNHPGIVDIYDLGQADDTLYIAMEYVDGPTLQDKLTEWSRTGRQLPLHEALALVSHLSHTMSYAHEQGVLHRDLKPANIMLRPQRNPAPNTFLPYHAVITDLGLAKLEDEGLVTRHDLHMPGTPVYMSPEQAQGHESDARTDVYALGLMLYELTVGRRPFPIKSLTDAVRYHVFEAPPPPRAFRRDLPAPVEAVILRTLAKKPEERYASAVVLAEAIDELVTEFEARSAPADPSPATNKPRERETRKRSLARPLRTSLLSIGLLLLLGFLTWGFAALIRAPAGDALWPLGGAQKPTETTVSVMQSGTDVTAEIANPSPTTTPTVVDTPTSGANVVANAQPVSTATVALQPVATPTQVPTLAATPTRDLMSTPLSTPLGTATAQRPTSTPAALPTATQTPMPAPTVRKEGSTAVPVPTLANPVANLLGTMALIEPLPDTEIGKSSVEFKFVWQPNQKERLVARYPNGMVELSIVKEDGTTLGLTNALPISSVPPLMSITVRSEQWRTMLGPPWSLQLGHTYGWTVRLGYTNEQNRFVEIGRLAPPRNFRFNASGSDREDARNTDRYRKF